MIRCANCGCQNIDGAKECTNCRCILLKGGISFKPATFTRSQKLMVSLFGIVFLAVALFLTYEFLSEFIMVIKDGDMISGIIYLIFGLFSIFPILLCFGVAWIIYFSLKHGKEVNDVSNLNSNNYDNNNGNNNGNNPL